jgi:predicted RNA binding protein YcfA (HicA-like mRNA interferase family)
MPRIPRVSRRDAVCVLGKAGFVVVRQGKHIIMRRGDVAIQIPRHTEINAATMGGIAKTAGLTPEQFRTLL